ncbi:Fe-S cluster assembly ATPase SufC [Candidatus Poribacteria bacterium]|jgi:Fe-S cluster assembly ATP-binding protein|nr:Fe-S cluster assembly ATPase SufC [Candidatus Poribacteria bacterium]MAG85775.1 Fe-S cluster assembly ATPase SufC [Candidatus Poribacteria bacterium]MEC9257700.1 Fe-S cluster assembly ATPase SufC [Candidatus Poribacteria bacterium]
MNDELVIRDLRVNVAGGEILKGLSLTVKSGEIHALMGPNGCGKSTLANTLMGHPNYNVDSGNVTLNGIDILELEPDERAKLGLFLAFQYPTAIPGVTLANFLRMAVSAVRAIDGNDSTTNPLVPMREFRKELREKMKKLAVDDSFARRYLNDGLSGGEKKRAEILQLAMLEPKIAVLDETDSGLDIDAIKIVGESVSQLVGPNLGVLIITHYPRLLNYIKPHFVHVILDGRIVESGGWELAEMLEAEGYEAIREKHSIEFTTQKNPIPDVPIQV